MRLCGAHPRDPILFIYCNVPPCCWCNTAPLAPCDPVIKQRNGVVNVAWTPGSAGALSAARFSAPPVTSVVLQVFGPLPLGDESNAEDDTGLLDGSETASMQLTPDVTDVNVSGLARGSVFAFKVRRLFATCWMEHVAQAPCLACPSDYSSQQHWKVTIVRHETSDHCKAPTEARTTPLCRGYEKLRHCVVGCCQNHDTPRSAGISVDVTACRLQRAVHDPCFPEGQRNIHGCHDVGSWAGV